jgi:hypothetical protein
MWPGSSSSATICNGRRCRSRRRSPHRGGGDRAQRLKQHGPSSPVLMRFARRANVRLLRGGILPVSPLLAAVIKPDIPTRSRRAWSHARWHRRRSSKRPRVDAGGLQPGIQGGRISTQVGRCGNRGVSPRTRSLAGEPIDERDRRWSATYYLQPRQIVSLRFSFSSSA